MIHIARLTALSLVVPIGFIAVPASAAESPDKANSAGRMMLVLDSSGSMKEKATGGVTKIAAAKEALATVINGLPAGQDVGLRVYGAKVFSHNDKGACTDSQRVVDPSSDNRAELKAAIATYKPYGETPIGYALQQAGKDLGAEGQRTIVLVSDGEPTCDPDPCAVAADLSKDGIGLRIDVVGLNVSGKARDKLTCIADKGHGTYYDANDAAGLTQSLNALSTRAFRPFDLTGIPVTGTPDRAGAPKIKRGQYLDKAPLTGSVSYRINRVKPGSTIHVGLTLGGAGGSAGSGVRLRLHDGAGKDATQCSSALAFGSAIGERHPLLFGSASSWSKTPNSTCNTSDAVYATIENDDQELAGHPVEIAVYVEPPLADPSGRNLMAAPTRPTWETLKPGTPVDDVVPGTSIASAPVVEDGTYGLDINPGESQVFAIPLDWGQHVQAQVDAPLNDAIKNAGGAGSGVEVNIISPVRGGSEVSFYGVEPSDWTTTAFGNLWTQPENTFRTGAQSQTISYLNRSSFSSDVNTADLAGVHYIQVTYNVIKDVNLPYTLTLKTNGAAGEGAPEYAKVASIVAPQADSKLVTSTVTQSGTSGNPHATSGKKSASGDLPVLPIGLGLIGVVALGGAAYVFLSSRRAV